jgi:hypothetical protein
MLSYMTSGTLDWERFLETSSCQLCLISKPSHVGVDVDRLACPLHRPTVCGRPIRGQSFMSGVALSHHAAVGGGAFLEGAKPLGLVIWWRVDCPATCAIESYVKKFAFIKARLSYVKVIMAIMRVSFIESLCQTAIGWIPALEYMLSGMRGLLWPRPIVVRQ